MLESKIEEYLVREVKKAGGIAYKFTSPQRRSVPDRLVVMPRGRTFFVELKATGKKPTDAQLREHIRLQNLDHQVFVIDSKEGVDKFILCHATTAYQDAFAKNVAEGFGRN